MASSPSPSPSPETASHPSASFSGGVVLSVRIVSLDYYMAAPIAGLDFERSPFHGGEVEEVPVIRIYGSTPAGQKTCLHVHRVLPYLYIPCPDELLHNPEEGNSCVTGLLSSLEKALKVRGPSKRQHVHGCSLVRAKKLYGFYSKEELFLKIYLYYPHEVSRAASLLLGGAIVNRIFQPYESHIPYLLHFLVDYNLYGMSHIHVSDFKFRPPLPVALHAGLSFHEKVKHAVKSKDKSSSTADFQADCNRDAVQNPAIWISSTVPSALIWGDSASGNVAAGKTSLFSCRSSLMLEADASVDGVLNKEYKMYTSLSQAAAEVKMVQSLIAIWEELEHSGLLEESKPPDLVKPQPEDVLRSFLHGLEYEKSLFELLLKEEVSHGDISQAEETAKLEKSFESLTDIIGTVTFSENDYSNDTDDETSRGTEKENQKARLSCVALPYQNGQAISPGIKTQHSAFESIGYQTTSQPLENKDQKHADAEALGLLSWLASTQAAEDLTTDDELTNEVILSPMFPKKSIEVALEAAHLDFDSASQQECQDILDSVEAQTRPDELKAQTSYSRCDNSASSGDTIPQVDGSSDENVKLPQNRSSKKKEESPSYPASRSSSKPANKRRGTELPWGSLPLSFKKKVQECAHHPTSPDNLVSDHRASNVSYVNKVEKSCHGSINAGREPSGTIREKALAECSVRDLMRRKRLFRPELLEPSSCRAKAFIEDMSHVEDFGGLECHNFTEDLPRTDLSHVEDACLQMTFMQKPPSKNQVDTTLESFPGGIGHAQTARQGSMNLLQFFSQNMEEKKQNESFQHMEGINIEQDALGVPTHFQNDGSALYLLTHAFSPPSLDSVCQWLFQQTEKSCSNNDCGDSKSSISCLAQNPSWTSHECIHAAAEDLFYGYADKMPCVQQDAPGVVGHNSLPQYREALPFVADIPGPKSGPESILTKSVIVDTVSTESRKSVIQIKERESHEGHDFSQISGAHEKHRLTPLSQIGFRDPANTGGGQQLTIMSLEVLADCRGDLRPDPQFDAINVVSLAVEDDTSSTVEVYVLTRDSIDEPSRRNMDGISGCSVDIFSEEKDLLNHLVVAICSIDPDILIGWEIQLGSLGFLAERAARLGIGLLKSISRTPASELKEVTNNSANCESAQMLPEALAADAIPEDFSEDDWGHTHASGIHVGGRIVLNLWRLMRAEVKLNIYTLEAVADEVLRRKIPSIPCKILNRWFATGPGRARHRCIEYLNDRANLNLEIINQLDMINRTSELARVFGIDFFSVLSRGSQFRVESMLLRLAHTQNYLAISPGSQQVAFQPAMECLPLVMEPESGFYSDPVVVLDFQSLYPSMIIAYNLCYSTCLGKIFPSKSNALGVSSYSADPRTIIDLKNHLLLAPNGVLYVQPKVRKGVLPRLLEEILSTRIMVKQVMKKLVPSQQVLQRIYNARQLALKLIANVTYGYTAAGFSGRMPCAELADSIVQCGRRTLETAISFVNEHPMWKARVVYGDTDSMFVLLKGRSMEEAFKIGKEIASAVTAMNPDPVTLKFEKVYCSCFLLTKKRYVGYSYESPDQREPIFDAKGIETVRRDACPAVAKILERSIKIMFEDQDLAKVRTYLERQWTRILSGKVSIQDFVFAKEVRLGTYSARASSLPPAAIVATKAMLLDPRAAPRYAERVPYVVIHGEPGARLIDMVVDPYYLLEVGSPYRLNDLYYINKQIIPALQRVFGLLGADLIQWFSEMPRPARPTLAKRHSSVTHASFSRGSDYSRPGLHKKAHSKGSRIDTYYISKHCTICGDLVQGSENLCNNCSRKEAVVAAVVVGRTSKLEKEIQHLAAICGHCGGADWVIESGVKCISLACPVFFERRKVQRELRVLSESAGEAGYYPFCTAELF